MAGPIVCSYKSFPLEWSSYSNCNSHFQALQLFTVASLGLLPVILSSIKRRDNQEGNSVFSKVKRSKMVCVGDNSFTQTTHKTMHNQIVHPVFFLVQYATKSWGRAWEWGYFQIQQHQCCEPFREQNSCNSIGWQGSCSCNQMLQNHGSAAIQQTKAACSPFRFHMEPIYWYRPQSWWGIGACNTRHFQVVLTHPTTQQAWHCLTSVNKQEPVHSAQHGCRHKSNCIFVPTGGTALQGAAQQPTNPSTESMSKWTCHGGSMQPNHQTHSPALTYIS